jgi:hypothetical protein
MQTSLIRKLELEPSIGLVVDPPGWVSLEAVFEFLLGLVGHRWLRRLCCYVANMVPLDLLMLAEENRRGRIEIKNRLSSWLSKKLWQCGCQEDCVRVDLVMSTRGEEGRYRARYVNSGCFAEDGEGTGWGHRRRG